MNAKAGTLYGKVKKITSKPSKEEMTPFVVNDKDCKGCKYYGWLSGRGNCRMCNYTYVTKRVRPYGEPCSKCSVKEDGPLEKPKTAFDEARMASMKRCLALKEKRNTGKEENENEDAEG